jgi:uncharacterized protein YecE (DUF72 family)
MDETIDSRVYVGMGGWALPAFDADFYPARTGKGFRKLEYLSLFFDMVEVNATFYTTELTARQSSRWLVDVSHNKWFLFTVKLFQGFTHTMNATEHDVTAIHKLLEPLVREEKLGGLVLQFPHSFVNSEQNRRHMKELSETFRRYPLFVEVRHDSWNRDETFQFLRDHKLHLVNVDLPQIKRHMPFTTQAWGDVAYFRMMGRNAKDWNRGVQFRYNYFYSQDELEDLARRIETVQPKTQRTFAVFHNDPNAHSPVNGFQLRRILNNKETMTIPSNLVAKFPQLREIVEEH